MSSFYHYTESGLPNVHLKNGFFLEEIDGEEYLSIDDIQGLHHAIALQLVEKTQSLTGKEFRFFRQIFNHSRRVLGELLGVDQQTVGRWEKGESTIPKTVDAAIRQLYLESVNEDSNLSYLLQRLAEAEAEEMMSDILMEERDHHWFSTIQQKYTALLK